MKIEIDNPCYHCYTGALGECYGIGCKYVSYPWSGDLEADYKVEYDSEMPDGKRCKDSDNGSKFKEV